MVTGLLIGLLIALLTIFLVNLFTRKIFPISTKLNNVVYIGDDMGFNRSLMLNVINFEKLKQGVAYKIKNSVNTNVEFEESFDNNQQNYYIYSSPRPRMCCLFIDNTYVFPPIDKAITEFQEKTNLKISYIL